MGTALRLDRVTGLPVPVGSLVTVTGAATTSLDGSTFFVATRVEGQAPGAVRQGGLFDLGAGGFTLLAQADEGATATLVATGEPGAACARAGAPSPCFVPRLTALGLDRLKTAGELSATLVGGFEVTSVVTPPPPPVALEAATAALGLAVVAAAVTSIVTIVRRRARTAVGRIRSAALEALALVRKDATLAPMRERLLAMLRRADELESVRRACAARLGRMDRLALDRRRDAVARSASPDAAEALTWLTAEQAEAARLESDLASSVLGLERIESALRVVALRVRAGRGTTSRAAKADPVDLAALELTLRDEATLEAEAAVR